jgi:hypothetical protein
MNTPLSEAFLTATLSQAFGAGCHLVNIQRLGGGTRKQVFRLDLNAPFSPVVLLIWHNEKDYFNEQADLQGPFSDAMAPRLYSANTQLLLANGVKVPEIYILDDARSEVPYAFALVEMVQGMSFNQFRSAHPGTNVAPILEKMKATLQRLHSIQRQDWGTVLDKLPHTEDFADHTLLVETLPDLRGLAQVHAGVKQKEDQIYEHLQGLRAQMIRRKNYVFVHNELGPDEHFIITSQGEISMLDIDGCHFADLEREYAYLRLRFGEYYPALARPDLDPLRVDFYQICLHIMAAYGHYLLLSQGYPGVEDLRRIYEVNANKALAFLR